MAPWFVELKAAVNGVMLVLVIPRAACGMTGATGATGATGFEKSWVEMIDGTVRSSNLSRVG